MWRLAASCGRAALVAAAPAPGPFRSEVARRHAGGPRLSRPYPRRARSEVKSRGVMREGRACRGRTRAASRSEVKSRGVMREGRACRGRTRAGPRSNALRRAPSSPLPEISVRNKISSIARTAISESVIASAIRYCGSQRPQRSQSLCGLRSAPPLRVYWGRTGNRDKPSRKSE